VVNYRQVRWEGLVVCVGEKINAYRLLFVETDGLRRLLRPAYKGEADRCSGNRMR